MSTDQSDEPRARVKAAAAMLNSLNNMEIARLVEQVEDRVLKILVESAPQPAGRAGGGGYKGGDKGGGDKGAGKGGGFRGGGKGKPRAPVPVPAPLDRPELLPGALEGSGEPVAFQVGTGTPWKLLGGVSGTFRWDLQDRDAVGDADKGDVRQALDSFAAAHGIPLADGTVKLALRRGPFWISRQGGISSTTGKAAVVKQSAGDHDGVDGGA